MVEISCHIAFRSGSSSAVALKWVLFCMRWKDDPWFPRYCQAGRCWSSGGGYYAPVVPISLTFSIQRSTRLGLARLAPEKWVILVGLIPTKPRICLRSCQNSAFLDTKHMNHPGVSEVMITRALRPSSKGLGNPPCRTRGLKTRHGRNARSIIPFSFAGRPPHHIGVVRTKCSLHLRSSSILSSAGSNGFVSE